MTSREALKILQDGWIQLVQLKGNDEESTKENIKAQEAYAYIIELLKQKNEIAVLDKIRAEIKEFADILCSGDRNVYYVLHIIDKYKAESEE